MKASEIRGMKDAEISAEITKLRTQFFDLGTKRVTDTVENTAQFRSTRRDIARLLTERRARTLKASASADAARPAAGASDAATPQSKPVRKAPAKKAATK